jgi:hypothetical protein
MKNMCWFLFGAAVLLEMASYSSSADGVAPNANIFDQATAKAAQLNLDTLPTPIHVSYVLAAAGAYLYFKGAS